jgi:hypothetical protein
MNLSSVTDDKQMATCHLQMTLPKSKVAMVDLNELKT